MSSESDFLNAVRERFDPEGLGQITKALNFAKLKHMGQKRDSGEDYIIHPINVAYILVMLSADKETVIAGLLHDCLDQTDTSEKEISDAFGAQVLSLLVGVKQITNIKRAYLKNGGDNESLQKMFLAMGSDSRIALIKLAERLHNMQTLEYKSLDTQKRIANETLDIYVPLAERMGMSVFKKQMEELCFKYLYPEDYERVTGEINEQYKRAENIINDITQTIKKLAQKGHVEVRVQARQKSAYGVYKKWKQKGKENVFDIIALRIICKSVADCYTMLGAVNNQYKVVEGRIKDYIAHPKENLYMSLHTTVLYPMSDGSSVPFEIQIRTEEMHSFCEYGMAAHWIYKSRGIEGITKDKLALQTALKKDADKLAVENKREYLKNIKEGFYSDKIFVFTPNLDVIELPVGSNPIDFAYNIHSGLGNKTVGARVNGKMVQLPTPLKTGDIVEVITSSSSKGPSRDWLKIAKSPQAQSKIKAFFKKERREENIRLGRDMLEEFAKRNGTTLAKLLEDKDGVNAILEKFKQNTVEDIYAYVGFGGLTCSQAFGKLILGEKEEKKARQQTRKSSSGGSVIIGGHTDLLMKFAKCCNPIPGDDIVGFVSRGKGVTIHRKDCPYLLYVEPERKIKTEWGENLGGQYDASFHIVMQNNLNAVSQISSKIADNKIDITHITLEKVRGLDAHYLIGVKIASRKQLVELMNRLRSIEGLYDIYR